MTLTFRRWKRPQVVADRTYRSPAGQLHVTAVDVVAPEAISDEGASCAGYEPAAALRAQLRGDPADPVYRVEFRYVDEADPRDLLAATDRLTGDDVAKIDHRPARLDQASRHSPWTERYLEVSDFTVLRVLVDRPDKPAQFLILGSASGTLLRHTSETLAARIAYLDVPPFTSREVGVASLERLWNRGGFPRSSLADDDAASSEWRENFTRTSSSGTSPS